MAVGSRLTCTLVAAVAGSLTACGPCDTSIVPSIVVEVVDSLTSDPAAADALGLATDGGYVDTLEVYARDATRRPLSLATRGERAGNYSVRVTRTGYVPWEQGDIRIRQDRCHTNQAQLTARLQPEP